MNCCGFTHSLQEPSTCLHSRTHRMHEGSLLVEMYLIQTSNECGPIAQPSNPSVERGSDFICLLPFLCSMAGNGPAQSYTCGGHQRVEEHDLVCLCENGLDKGFLFLPPISPDNPDVDNSCLAVCLMSVPPLLDFKWSALEFDGPTLSIGMGEKDISNAVRFRQSLIQCYNRLCGLFMQSLSKHTRTACVTQSFRIGH